MSVLASFSHKHTILTASTGKNSKESDIKGGLLVFTRFPVAGITKTRLIPELGAEGAANLQKRMTTHLIRRLGRLHLKKNAKFPEKNLEIEDFLPEIVFQVHFSGGNLAQMRDWVASILPDCESDSVRFFKGEATPSPVLISQCEGSLGDRLSFAIESGFASGLSRIVVIGSDCPAIDESKILQALALLRSADVVLGPALDGGYYLIGLNQAHSCLFEGIDWSTDKVLAQTLAIATQQNLSVALLDPLADIDRPEDLPLWYALEKEILEGERMGTCVQ